MKASLSGARLRLQLEENVLVSQTFLLFYCRVSVMQISENLEKSCDTVYLLWTWMVFKLWQKTSHQ